MLRLFNNLLHSTLLFNKISFPKEIYAVFFFLLIRYFIFRYIYFLFNYERRRFKQNLIFQDTLSHFSLKNTLHVKCSASVLVLKFWLRMFKEGSGCINKIRSYCFTVLRKVKMLTSIVNIVCKSIRYISDMECIGTLTDSIGEFNWLCIFHMIRNLALWKKRSHWNYKG